MIGDILFYRNKGTLPDTIITIWEGAVTDFVHVAIQTATDEKTEALFKEGVVVNKLNNARIATVYSPEIDQNNVTRALNWLHNQVNQAYGYGDILDIVLNHPVIECHYDCSALAAEFLKRIRDPKIDLKTNVHLITPQKLADLLGVK